MSNLRCLETIRSPSELNRLLLEIQEYRRLDGRAYKERLEKALKEHTFQAGPVPFDDLIDLALHFRLIHVHEDSVSITPTGLTFLNENPNNQYALTEAQKDILVQSILFGRTQLSKQFELILGDFTYNPASNRFEGAILATSGRMTGLGIRLFCSALGFINEADDGIRYLDQIFNTQIQRRIRILRNTELDGQEPSQLTLDRSKHAELLIYDREKFRLDSTGFPELSRRVQLVSEFNSQAGFDIQSFEGEGSKPEVPDRFIEVKSSLEGKINFVISRNELKRASELREQYHILFVGNHDIGKALSDCRVEVITDPAEQIFLKNKFILDAKKLRVIERSSDISISEN